MTDELTLVASPPPSLGGHRADSRHVCADRTTGRVRGEISGSVDRQLILS